MRTSLVLPVLLTVALATAAVAAPPALRPVPRKPVQDSSSDFALGGWTPQVPMAQPAPQNEALEPASGFSSAPAPVPTPATPQSFAEPEENSPEEGVDETTDDGSGEAQREAQEAEVLKPYRRNPFWTVQYASSKKDAHEAAVAAQNDPTRLAEIEEAEKRRSAGILNIPDDEWEEMEKQLPQTKGIMPTLYKDPRPAVAFRGAEYWNQYFHEGDVISITNRGVVYHWTITNISYAVGTTGCYFGRTSAVSETFSNP